MKFSLTRTLLLLAALLCGSANIAAEDIDLYEDGGGASGAPNLLIVLDNAANFDASTSGLTCTYADGSGAPSLAGTLAASVRNLGPAWYPVALTVLALPTAWLGGALYVRNASRR